MNPALKEYFFRETPPVFNQEYVAHIPRGWPGCFWVKLPTVDETCAITIQRAWREYWSKKQERIRRNKAAKVIQSIWKYYWYEERDEHGHSRFGKWLASTQFDKKGKFKL